MTSNNDYWLYGDSKQVVDKLVGFHTNWVSWSGNPFKQMWIRNYMAYYSPVVAPGSVDTSLMFEGVQGELVRLYTPKARTLMRQLTAVVTKQRLAFRASARTSGSEVLNEVKLANALADQIVSNQRLNIKGDTLCEGSLVTGTWFTKTCWRTDFGEPYTRDQNGKVITNGGVEITTLSPFDVFYNLTLPWDENLWVECRVKRNRWDLIADHPDLETEIRSLPSVSEELGQSSWLDSNLGDEDMVYVYEFFHKPTPSLPKGRMLIYGDSDTVFFDDVNAYETIPIEPNIPEAVLGAGVGYSKLTDLLGCQEMFDNSLSAVATNQSQFAVQNVAVPRGSNINVNELNGMNFISFTPQNVPGGGKPEALQLTKTAPETFKFTDKLEQLMQDMSYLNGAMTGNLPAGVTSGTAIATLATNSIEFITSISKSYNLCWERTMMHAINAYQKFAKIPQKVKIAQKGGQVTQKEITQQDIINVSDMQLEIVSPVMKSFAGRLEIATQFLQMPQEKWGQFASIIEGNPLSEIYKGEVSELDLINQENEKLEDGQNVPVLAVDDHPLHIQKHSEILADVGNRQNNESIKAVLDHIMEHYTQLKQADPTLLGIMKTGRIPEGGIPQPPPPNMSGGAGGKPPQGPPVDRPGPAPDRPQPVAQPAGDVAEPSQDLLQRG